MKTFKQFVVEEEAEYKYLDDYRKIMKNIAKSLGLEFQEESPYKSRHLYLITPENDVMIHLYFSENQEGRKMLDFPVGRTLYRYNDLWNDLDTPRTEVDSFVTYDDETDGVIKESDLKNIVISEIERARAKLERIKK